MHASSTAIDAVAEASTEPKASPLIVTLNAAVSAPFERAMKLDTGLSKVNTLPTVPTTPVTDTPTRVAPPELTGTKHRTVVPDVQPVLAHTSRTAIELVGVSSTDPNSKPEIVTLSAPL
jgi:hypothetical protein